MRTNITSICQKSTIYAMTYSLFALIFLGIMTGCTQSIFDSDEDSANDLVQTSFIDKLAPNDHPVDSVVNLEFHFYDSSLGAGNKSNWEDEVSQTIERIEDEGSTFIRYNIRSRRHGTWTQGLEFFFSPILAY